MNIFKIEDITSNIEGNSLILGDCLETMKHIKDNSVNLIVTDPPYGVDFSAGFDDSIEHVKEQIDSWLKEMYRVLKDTSHCYIFIPTLEADLWISKVKETGFTLMNILSTRTYTQNLYLNNNFTFNSQLVIYCSKGKAKRLNKVDFIPTSESWLKDKRNKNPKPYTYNYPSFLPYFSNEKTTSKSNNKNGRHPCSKNIEFIEFLIKLSSDENDTVLDPFLGGGSTGIASLNNNRKFIGIELNEAYFKNAKKRILKIK